MHDTDSLDPPFSELNSPGANFNWSRLLSHTGNLPQLVALYKKIVRTTRLNSVRTFYQKRIIKIESDQWSIQSNSGYRNFEKSFPAFNTYDSKEEIMVIDSSDMNQSFAMGEFLETSQIEYRIIDGIVLDDLSQLPNIAITVINKSILNIRRKTCLVKRLRMYKVYRLRTSLSRII